ncbi:MAG: PD-(D/E)XK nuclease family protein [Bacteroidetes bacterium]|nr:PD-(D/E)XK nuclease family protein [Bacteroidota bacterium]MDE2671115.1 PD-(D/E)XK nuclease family protein [Bacteroidota bacterium]
MHEKHTPLLAQISPMFSGRTEDVAVEALGYILNGSESARDALSEVLRIGGAEVGKIAEVETQVTIEDEARPDLAAYNEDGSRCVLIEAKFWAGLTKNQPITYLRHLLQEPKTSVLLFVAPHARYESLWAELKQRIVKSDFGISFKVERNHEALVSDLAGGESWMILTSWTSLLESMATKVSAAGDPKTAADIAQLRGLADKEDTTAFMPLRAEELGPDISRRFMGLKTLVGHVTERLVASDIADQNGLTGSITAKRYIKYIRLAGAGAAFGIDFDKWATVRDTPLWLTFYEWKNFKPLEEVWANLASFRRCDPPELFKVGGETVMPIKLSLGVERDAVLDAIVERLTEIAHQIDPAYRS